jgi:hypothetical protein
VPAGPGPYPGSRLVNASDDLGDRRVVGLALGADDDALGHG